MSGVSGRIGIMGGTFNPIHYGHLVIAEHSREQYNLDSVIFIPSGKPPHKDRIEVTGSDYRADMVDLAISSNPFFKLSDVEIQRKGITYTVDTLEEFIEIYGYGMKLFFIIGADNLSELVTWKRFRYLFEICEIITAFRPGVDNSSIFNEAEYLKSKYNASINIVNTPLISISSTSIRDRIKRGESIKYLVPPEVEDYILKNLLYRGKY